MSSEIKTTMKFTAIYAVGIVFNRIASFIMLPIYTRYLTPKDYGIMELLDMTVDVITVILGMGLHHAIFRFYHKFKSKKDKKEVISTLFILMSVLNSIAFLVLFIFSKPLSQMLFDSLFYSLHFKIMAFTLLFRASVSLPLMYLQAIQKPKAFVIINFVKLLIQLTLNIYFVVFLDMKVLGILYSSLIASVGISFYLLPYILRESGFKYSQEKAMPMIKFGIPLVINGFASFYLQFSDRYFIKFCFNLSEVGIYSLGYKFGFILTMFVLKPFSNIWDVQRFEIYKKDNAKDIYQKAFLMMSFILIISSFFLSIFCRDFLRIMASSEYETAYKVVPVILLAFTIQGWTAFVNLGIMLSEKTIHIAVSTYLAAITVTIFCLLLIPELGSLGAAYATLIAFTVRFFWVKHKSYGFYNMGLVWKKPMILLSLASSIFIVSSVIHVENIYLSIFVNIVFSVLFLSSIILLPLLPEENKAQLIKIIKSPIAGIKELKKDFSSGSC